MKKILVLVAVLYSAAAIAQSSPPAPAGSDAAKTPMVGDKPLVTVKPKGTAKKKKDATQDASTDAAKDAPAAAPKAGAKPAPGQAEIDRGQAAGLHGDRRCDQGAPELL